MAPDEPHHLPEDFLRPGAPGSPPSTGPVPGPAGHPTYAPLPYGYGYGQPTPPEWRGPWPTEPPRHPNATTAMVLGIVGLAGSPFSCGLTLLLSPVAWVMGGRAVKQIQAAPTRWSGANDADSGRVTGLVGTVLLAIAVPLLIAFVALMFTAFSEVSVDDGVSERSTVPGSSTRM